MSRVKQVLDEAGIGYSEIAKRANIDEDRLAQIAAGGDFSVAELSSLASALGVPISAFSKKDERQTKIEFLFRKTLGKDSNSGTIPAVNTFSNRLANVFEFAVSTRNKLSWLDHFSIEDESYEQAEFCAEKFRAIYFNGDMHSPIFKLPEIVTETLDILLFVVPEQSVEGASALVDGRAFIFLSPRTFTPRMFFTLAHELGHLIAGHFAQSEIAYIDRIDTFGRTQAPRKRSEAFADAFASSLLMPASGVGVALQRIRAAIQNSGALTDVELLYLSRIFGVSFEVAARRCEDLQLLPSGAARSLYDYLCAKFGSPEKRAEDLKLPERPRIEIPKIPTELLSAAIERIRRGDVSIGKASEMLKVSIADLYKYNAAALH